VWCDLFFSFVSGLMSHKRLPRTGVWNFCASCILFNGAEAKPHAHGTSLSIKNENTFVASIFSRANPSVYTAGAPRLRYSAEEFAGPADGCRRSVISEVSILRIAIGVLEVEEAGPSKVSSIVPPGSRQQLSARRLDIFTGRRLC
jgi:hypothetical protein